jgi:CDP-diacylglycerol--serine O-phosphatidyltransferase
MEAFDLEPRRIYEMRWVAWTLAMFAGLTMVSNIRFWSGKDINLRKSVPFGVVVLIALIIVILSQVADNIPELLFAMFVAYAVSGYVMWIMNRIRRKPSTPAPPATPPADGL